MRRSLAPVAALLISVSILLTGQGLQGTLLPVRATLENFTTLAIGAMGAAYFLGFTLGCLKGGQLIGKVGHVRVFAGRQGGAHQFLGIHAPQSARAGATRRARGSAQPSLAANGSSV